VFAAAATSFICLASGTSAYGTVALSWTFDGGDLSIHQALGGGSGTLSYKDAATGGATTFGVTDPSPPNPPGGQAIYLHHPQLPGGGDGGYQLNYTGVLPNGGGSYVNDYTMIFDVYIPALNWTPLFNADPGNTNDADWYVDPSGHLGIGELGYTAAPVVSAGTWHRLGFVHDRTAGAVKYWVDGVNVFSGAASPVDGRFSLYSSLDAISAHVNLHGEGDGSGNYTNEVYWNNFAFADMALSDDVMQALGGPTAGPIAIPEPSALAYAAALAACALPLIRRRLRVAR
jgi:hypothetical protein